MTGTRSGKHRSTALRIVVFREIPEAFPGIQWCWGRPHGGDGNIPPRQARIYPEVYKKRTVVERFSNWIEAVKKIVP